MIGCETSALFSCGKIKNVNSPAVRSVLGKSVSSVISTALGLTSRPVNNMYVPMMVVILNKKERNAIVTNRLTFMTKI